MESALDKKQKIKNIVANVEKCLVKNVEFIQLKDGQTMIVVPVLYSNDRKTIQDLYTQQTYTRQGRAFGSVATAEKLCDVYDYKHGLLTEPQYTVLGSVVGVQGFVKDFYNTYNVDTKLDSEYIRLTKKLKSYNYDSIETIANIIKLAKDIQNFFGGPVMVKEKVKTPRDDKKDELQIGM